MRTSFFLIFIFFTKIYSSKTTPYIWGGQPAEEGQFPHQVAIRYKTGKPHCSGAILSSRWILTARHCIKPNMSKFLVFVGSIIANEGSSHEIKYGVKHPGKKLTTDIGLLKLQTDIQFDSNVQPIKLSKHYVKPGSDVVICGWGQMEKGDAKHLMWANMKTISNEECYERLKYRINEKIVNTDLCTMQPNISVCSGDSGANLIMDGKVVGVTSRGIACGEGFPEVYVRVSRFKWWIKKHVKGPIFE